MEGVTKENRRPACDTAARRLFLQGSVRGYLTSVLAAGEEAGVDERVQEHPLRRR